MRCSKRNRYVQRNFIVYVTIILIFIDLKCTWGSDINTKKQNDYSSRIDFSTYFSENQTNPIAKARTGNYIGYWTTTSLGTVYQSFSGIRYAKPMTRYNRYKWAEVVDDSQEVFNATNEGSDCLQWNIRRNSFGIVGSEDCLFMNIYTPNITEKLPVMVVLACGHFFFDSASRYLNGPDYFMDTKEIVLVIFNYRLGPLGFVDFRSDEYPSNLGLKDQVVALQWIQRNIDAFGGDPKRITLQGTSSGAVSVHLHMMSPLSKGLFHAGISESGTGLDPWSLAYPLQARQLLTTLAEGTGCAGRLPSSSNDSADAVAECLRTRTAYEIVAATRRFDFRLMQMLFLPVIEFTKVKPFLPDDPYVVEEDGLPWLCGQNSDEMGLGVVLEKRSFKYLLARYYITLVAYEAIPFWLNYEETASNPSAVTGQILYHYSGTFMPNESQIMPTLIKAGNDGGFTNPHYMSLLKHQGPIYSYLFSYRQTYLNGSYRKPDEGVTHSEEQFYLFTKQGIDIQKDNPHPDGQMSKTLVKLWVNFIKYHNPTPDGSEFPKWSLWTAENNLSYSIGQDSLKTITDQNQDCYQFWKTLPFRDKMKPFTFYINNTNNNSVPRHIITAPNNSTSKANNPNQCRYLYYLLFIFIILMFQHNTRD